MAVSVLIFIFITVWSQTLLAACAGVTLRHDDVISVYVMMPTLNLTSSNETFNDVSEASLLPTNVTGEMQGIPSLTKEIPTKAALGKVNEVKPRRNNLL